MRFLPFLDPSCSQWSPWSSGRLSSTGVKGRLHKPSTTLFKIIHSNFTQFTNLDLLGIWDLSGRLCGIPLRRLHVRQGMLSKVDCAIHQRLSSKSFTATLHNSQIWICATIPEESVAFLFADFMSARGVGCLFVPGETFSRAPL